MLKTIILGLALIAATQPPTATSDPAESNRPGPSNDPRQVVCLADLQPGSRLTRRRVCRTRAEWAAHQVEYRQKIEIIQRPRSGQ